jgi:hypothetical protein
MLQIALRERVLVGALASKEVGSVLEIKKTAIALEDSDLIELERILIDSDREQALRFLRKSVYEKVLHSQQGRLKSHLNGESNPADKFHNEAEGN